MFIYIYTYIKTCLWNWGQHLHLFKDHDKLESRVSCSTVMVMRLCLFYIYIYSIIVIYIYILFTPRIIIQSETTKLEKRVPTLHASGRGWTVYLNRPFRVSWNQMILGQRWTSPVVHEANECLKKNHKLSIPTLRPRYSLVRHGSASFSKAKAKKTIPRIQFRSLTSIWWFHQNRLQYPIFGSFHIKKSR